MVLSSVVFQVTTTYRLFSCVIIYKNREMTVPKIKSILITGCSSGIGLRAAQRLQQRGYQVFASVRQAKDVAILDEKGIRCLILDLNSSKSIQQALNQLLSETNGTLNALFNNGAYGQPGAVEDLSRDALRAQFETNLFGTHELTCKVVAIMRQQGYGRIVQNSSVLGFASLPFRGAYNASKHALEALTDTLRMELDDSDINISLIEPGPIQSHFRKNAYAAFKKHIDVENSHFKPYYHAVENRLSNNEGGGKFTLSEDAVVDKLIHALESNRPKPRYYVTFPTYLFGYLRRVLSTKMMDRILLAVSRDENG